MAWMWLVLAGVLEIAWSAGLKASDGLSHPVTAVFTVVAMIGSFVCLAFATRSLPLSVAYPVWVGMGAIGAAVMGWWWFDERMTTTKVGWLLLLVVAIGGLATSRGAEAAPAADDLSAS